jgi:ZIP family zinc transporter
LYQKVDRGLELTKFSCCVCCAAHRYAALCPNHAAALHNIPEGLVIAAPLYAATGSKLKALGMTAASGLSEPVGALLALLVFKPFVTSLAQLDYVLAVTGGVMLAVCVLELWPEGRRCGQDVRLMQGIALGTAVLGWTLYVGV